MTAKNKLGTLLYSLKGQGLIETLALSFAVMGFITVLGSVGYFSFVHMGISYLLHENNICEETRQATTCRQDFLNKSKVFLFAARIVRFESSRIQKRRYSRAEIEMPLHRRLKIQKEWIFPQ